MGNELTPQEQYSKFYKDPHLWIGAIEVECIEKHLELKDDPRSEVSLGALYLYDAEMYNSIWLFGNIDKYKPLFKPQEGDQFIKDLESAVSAGCGGESVTHYKTPSSIVFEVDGGEIEIWSYLKITTSSGIAFDTAAYVDTLRKLGYYL